MVITVTFTKSEPTLAMWSFAQTIAKALDLKLPKYEYEAVSEFLNFFSPEFYRHKKICNYDFWNYTFWMNSHLDEEDEWFEYEHQGGGWD
jgi:hypothetical protein